MEEGKTQGRRIDEVAEDEYRWPFPILQPGDYGKSLGGPWYCAVPNQLAMIGNLASHKIEEHEDQTITVSPSILVSNGKISWHGYLERGVWRRC